MEDQQANPINDLTFNQCAENVKPLRYSFCAAVLLVLGMARFMSSNSEQATSDDYNNIVIFVLTAIMAAVLTYALFVSYNIRKDPEDNKNRLVTAMASLEAFAFAGLIMTLAADVSFDIMAGVAAVSIVGILFIVPRKSNTI